MPSRSYVAGCAVVATDQGGAGAPRGGRDERVVGCAAGDSKASQLPKQRSHVVSVQSEERIRELSPEIVEDEVVGSPEVGAGGV